MCTSLRVSTRRAVEAVRVFSELISDAVRGDLLADLRRLRVAADEARNLDVLCAEFVRCATGSCEETCRQIADTLRQRREKAQQPMLVLYRELAAGGFSERIAGLLKAIKSEVSRKSEPTFAWQASRYLEPVVKKFLRASKADLSDDEALHRLRIRTKKLRYTMEIVAVAFAPRFRQKLYRQVSAFQDVMGMVNDHATAKALFSDWVATTDDLQQAAFFRGILLAETKAHEDLRQALYAMWTPHAVKKLRQQFRACCGFS